ncbi:MAG TPA: hypothetical protein VE172_11580 [Stackebrandtia sp.]|uniref:DUF6923 family protein n=1 Tax=Stackebrandtia sp. TaxID=2023065 RepID=UPI002D23C60C|nr:hypothetical protein [Stackebrandtia sp.]HZE39438.1 hypothetical protein [Stackebrandtia sp.]
MARRSLVFLSCLGLALIALVPLGPAAQAAPGDPFPSGPGLVFVAQGNAPGDPTTLYTAEQGTGEITFTRQGTVTTGYNAMGYRAADGYLYAINNNDGLVRIGQGGALTALGQVGLTHSTYNYNQGTFGAGATADTLYVRLATSDRNLYAVDVNTRTTTRIALSANVPNLSDFVWLDGYLWGVYGEGNRLYRIDPNTGDVLSVAGAGLPQNPYGAQWVYGNGNIGVSNNVTGTVYQLQLNNPSSDNPSLTLISSTKGPSNTQNDGASYAGARADLGIVKDGPATWTADEELTYTLRVHNYGDGDSSGYIVTDDLPSKLVDPQTSTPGCAISGTGADAVVRCTAAALAAGDDGPAITITGRAPAQAGTDCAGDGITNTAHVLGNEADPTQTNNTATSTACPSGTTPPSFAVSKTADPSTPDHAKPGDRVTYTITVTNTGGSAYTESSPASFTDRLNNVVDDATVDADSITGGASLSDRNITWSGPLDVGATHTVTYQVVVDDPDTGDHILRNGLVPGGTGSCASDGACEVETPIADFTVAKTATPDSVRGGDTVTYSLRVVNTGAVPLGSGGGSVDPADAVVQDSLAKVLPYADYNNDADHGGTLSGDTLTWHPRLAVGAETTLTYSVTVHDDVDASAVLTNVATPNDYGRCPSDDACTTHTPVRAYTVSKAASPSTARPGQKVKYTVTVTNSGGADYTTDDPASFTDDLSDVLDDAKYNGDASGGATVSDDTLSWSGALAAGASKKITYSVTVSDPDRGDRRLTNVVVAGGDGGSCVSDKDCTTTVKVVKKVPGPGTHPPSHAAGGAPILAVTGASGLMTLTVLALLLVAAGGLLTWWGRPGRR